MLCGARRRRLLRQQPGDLWFPHVYEANQDPLSPDGANPFGRWDYATSKAWTLLPGDGLKTVHVRFRDNSLPAPGFLHVPVTTNITLDTTPYGAYSSPPVSVTLTASVVAKIYYTTDGTVPTAASTVYTGPISVTATTTIKYFGVDRVGNAEAVITGAWTINTGVITASMQINNGASITSNLSVMLSLLASVP